MEGTIDATEVDEIAVIQRRGDLIEDIKRKSVQPLDHDEQNVKPVFMMTLKGLTL